MELATLHGVDAVTALRLRAFTGLPVKDCCKALRASDGNYDLAVRWIAEGNWANCSLISWNHEVLQVRAQALQAEFGGDILARPAHVREAIMEILEELATSEEALAAVNWTRRKGPIASYHAAVASRSRVAARAVQKGCQRPAIQLDVAPRPGASTSPELVLAGHDLEVEWAT